MKIKPNPTCKICHGSGEVEEHHPYGSTTVTEILFCECVLEQLSDEEFDHCLLTLELDLSDYRSDRDEKRASDAFDDWNAGERPAHWI